MLGKSQLDAVDDLDVQAIYDLVGDKIRDIFQAQVVMISTYDKETETIEHRVAYRTKASGSTRQDIIPSADFGSGWWRPASRCWSARGSRNGGALGQPTLPGTITPKTWLGVPMIVKNHVTGV